MDRIPGIILSMAAVFGLASSACCQVSLELASPESAGMRSEALRVLSEEVRTRDLDMRSIVVVRDGRLVFEWYPGGVTRETTHNIYSITKSVTATLAGIAIAEKQIDGVEATIGDIFPLWPGVVTGARIRGITLDDLLTMRSGLPCSRGNRPSGPERVLFDRMHRAPDRLKLILEELEPVSRPGLKFVYGNVEPQFVMAAIEERSGMTAFDYAEKWLFDPLGFRKARWAFPDKDGRVPGGYGIFLRAIDLAKLGQLYLQKGKWRGNQVLPGSWVNEATRDRTGTGYGYYWWIDAKGGGYSARGVRGQRIEVYPSRGLVIVMTAQLPSEKVQPVTRAISQRILDAIESRKPIQKDQAATKTLEEELELASNWFPSAREERKKIAPGSEAN